jgi:hypothetical protein
MQGNRNRWGHGLRSLGAVLGIAASGACSSNPPAPGSGRADHAGNRAPAQAPSADAGPDPSPLSSVGPLSPLDWAIRNECPARPWSTKVPARACTNDSECGDGYCDRDRCAIIWTCQSDYYRNGLRCYGPKSGKSGLCPGLCLEGRCRSCLSDDECTTAIGVRAFCDKGSDDNRVCGLSIIDAPSSPPRPPYVPPPGSTWVVPEWPRPMVLRVNSEDIEKNYGIKLSPIEKAIVDDCPDRRWSKDVPDRWCTKHEQCGDGFCDRGHCAAIWTCLVRHGQRCTSHNQCPDFCVNGRCSSCASDAECAKRFDQPKATCPPRHDLDGRFCEFFVGSSGGRL